MKVEVSVQDCFFIGSRLQARGADSILCPISTSTWENWFYKWLEILQPNTSPSDTYELSLRLTDDVEIQALNHQYRQKNQPTDVLSFPTREVSFPQLPIEMQLSMPLELGDIVISVERADQQAQQQRHSLSKELAWLAAHGLLHLLGWDHPDQESLMSMLNQQETLLQMVGQKI